MIHRVHSVDLKLYIFNIIIEIVTFSYKYQDLLVVSIISFLLIMDACASKPWEIDLRDICQGLHCFFACCKGQIIIRTSEVDRAEIEDIEENVKKDLMTPILSGPILCFYVVQPVVEKLCGS